MNHCHCLDVRTKIGAPAIPSLHTEAQDTKAPGWQAALDLVRRAAECGATIFEPSAHIDPIDWSEVITLPQEIGSLDRVEDIRLYRSHLRQLPPTIGLMTALTDLDVYTSYSLHWLPYELTRCKNLRRSRMSTRALYGNRKTRLPFPRLSRPVEALLPPTCSVCDRAFMEQQPQLYWMTLRLGTDTVPLLVHSCSDDCTRSIPPAPAGYHARPHKGGGGVGMPEP